MCPTSSWNGHRRSCHWTQCRLKSIRSADQLSPPFRAVVPLCAVPAGLLFRAPVFAPGAVGSHRRERRGALPCLASRGSARPTRLSLCGAARRTGALCDRRCRERDRKRGPAEYGGECFSLHVWVPLPLVWSAAASAMRTPHQDIGRNLMKRVSSRGARIRAIERHVRDAFVNDRGGSGAAGPHLRPGSLMWSA